MYVESSAIELTSQHYKSSSHVIKESLLTESQALDRPANTSEQNPTESSSSVVSVASNDVINNASAPQFLANHIFKALLNQDEPASMEGLDAKTYSLKSMVETLTGKELDLSVVRNYWEERLQREQEAQDEVGRQAQRRTLQYDYYEKIEEAEETTFNAKGSFTTKNGDSIEFNLSHLMQREFSLERSISLQVESGELIDPLVINLNNTPLELTNQTFEFDLNANSSKERIHFVDGNSAFLAYDRNNNGDIDDGSELFGAITGDGFAELAQYDDDGNQWIDEADSIYNHLSLWQKGADSTDYYSSLKDNNIGAIYLGSASTPFELKDNDNNLQGMVRESGLFLKETGEVGLIHQVDLVV